MKLSSLIIGAAFAAITTAAAAHMPRANCGPMGCQIHNRHSGAACTAFGCGAIAERHGRGRAGWVTAFGVNSLRYNKNKGRSVWKHCGAAGCYKVKCHNHICRRTRIS